MTEGTYRALLSEICACVRTHGFRRLVLIGDSGGNQAGLAAVANELNAKWSGGKCRIYYIKEYYNYPEVTKWLDAEGVKQASEGLHDDFAITAQMATMTAQTRLKVSLRRMRRRSTIVSASSDMAQLSSIRAG